MQLVHPNKHPRLLLPAPEGASWTIRHIGPNLTEADLSADIALRVRALVAPSVEHTEWIEGVMREDFPADATLEKLAMESGTSPRGWPIVMAHYRITSGERVEERVGAFYAIVHSRAEVVARFKNGATWAPHQAKLQPYMLSAHVEWPDYDADLIYTQLGFQV